jgi:trehalose 2-sulfotransferase
VRMNPLSSYIICSVQRSGTHLLCSILEKTGLAGSPDEYFISGDDWTWEERWSSPSRAAYIERIFQQTTTPNGVCGFVVMRVYFDRMLQMLQEIPPYQSMNGSQLLDTIFNRPKYIWMRRRDHIQQAVSWAMALQTGVWVDKPGQTPQPCSEPRFDFDLIDNVHDTITAGEAGWANYFRENHIGPLVLFYEDIIASNHETAVRVLEFLGTPFPPTLETAAPTTQKQATSISREWAATYRKLKENKVSRLARALRRVRR